MKRIFVLFLILATVAGCASEYGTTAANPVEPGPVVVVPPRPAPVDPPPIPVPVDPTTPEVGVVPWNVVQQVPTSPTGMTRPDLVTLLGREPEGDRAERDGTRILRWKALDDVGTKRYLDVIVRVDPAAPNDRNKDTVLGRSLPKR